MQDDYGFQKSFRNTTLICNWSDTQIAPPLTWVNDAVVRPVEMLKQSNVLLSQIKLMKGCLCLMVIKRELEV